MLRIKRWLESRKLGSKERYDEQKEEFESAIGRPVINIKIFMPKGFEEFRTEFLNLDSDNRFLEEVELLVKKRLRRKKPKLKQKPQN